MPKFTFQIETMGCKANVTDSQTIEYRLRAIGGQPAREKADFYIMNSCTVTDRADRDALSLLRRSQAKHKLFTGCLAEVDSSVLAGKAEASDQSTMHVLRNSGKVDIVPLIQQILQQGQTRAAEPTPTPTPTPMQGSRVQWHKEIDFQPGSAMTAQSTIRTRAFLKVQDGCNQFCSFCIIPHARGRSRSLEQQKIVAEVQSMADSGVKEVVLTAIHAADYNHDGGYVDLVEQVLAKTNIPRVRLTSLDPAEIPDRLLTLMKENDRLCPHLHVSMQACDTQTLTRMQRAYDASLASDRLHAIASALPHAFVGMDIIAGFPGESDEEFENTFHFLQTHPWSRLHVFPYSVRRSTQAARLVKEGWGVPEKTIHNRARRLRRLSEERLEAILASKTGKPMEVLIENKTSRFADRLVNQGYSRSYFRVLLDSNIYEPNQLVPVCITGFDKAKGSLLGKGLLRA